MKKPIAANPLAEVKQLLRDIKKSKSPPLTKKRVKDRILELESKHSAILNQPSANLLTNLLVCLDQLRVFGQLSELYMLLNKPSPDYPMLQREGES
jgi:hypothetical protein